MGVIDDKKKVFGNIAALRTLNEGFPKLNLTNSLPSINNNTNTLDLLIDLLKSLIGYEQLRDIITDIITYQLSDFEGEIKKAIKLELKSIVSCGVDPSLPAFIKDTGDGVNIRVDKVDFLNIMKINPQSDNGKFVYDDILNQLTSEDFNTFLYYTIQSNGPTQNWGSQTSVNDILGINFNDDNGLETNVLNIKATNYYSNNKTLTDFNNDYVGSVSLFGTEKMITNIIDGLFGTLTKPFNKSQKQLEDEEKINSIIESIINLDDNESLSDNFFEFSNDEVQIIEENAKNRKNGIRVLKTCGNIDSSVPVSSIEQLSEGFSGTTNQSEVKEVVSSNIDDMAELSAGNVQNDSNKETVKLNFIELLLRRLMLSIVTPIISPKIMLIFILNYKIIYGRDKEYKDAVEFLKENKNLVRVIMNKIRDMVIKILLTKVLKEIAILVATGAAKRQIEKSTNKTAQLLSLVGVPQETIRLISNLT